MPPRKNVRKKTTPQKQVKEHDQNELNVDVTSTDNSVVADNGNSVTGENNQNSDLTVASTGPGAEELDSSSNDLKSDEMAEKMRDNGSSGNGQIDDLTNLPYRVKVSNLPASYVLSEFQKHIRHTFNIAAENIISPANDSPWLTIPFATKNEQEYVVKLLNNHVWKKRALRAVGFHASESAKHKLEPDDDEDDGDETSPKKPKLEENVLTLEEEILSESLPLYNVPYEEQNKLSVQDVQLLSNKLHAFMCVRNPALAGWAEAMCETNEGYIYKIQPLKPSPILQGYRNKCKFRIGKNADGEFTVGFCLNDNEKKILGVQPGDKLIHLPDSMKYAAKMFEKFIQNSGKELYDKKKKSGFWDHIIVRMVPGGELMLVVVMYHNHLSDENIASIKTEVKEFFSQEGKDCNLRSLYFQILNDKTPILPPDKLELLWGEPALIENICGLKFHVGPYSILNVNSPSAENIYKSIIELAEPTLESTVIDICSGTGGIAFTIAGKCKQVIAIETQEDNINDALKTKELNGITNVEFIRGKAEDELNGIFEKLGSTEIIPIIDPPRQGLVQKAISLLRSNANINKLVYVCSNSKMGVKNFLDLCSSSDKKEGTFGNPLNVEFAGLPFLPIKAIPVDVSPYTVNNTIIMLFERVDPSTFPPAKNPPPVPMKKPQPPKEEKKKHKKGHGNRRGGKTFHRFSGRGRNKKFSSQRGRGGGGPPRFGRHSRRGVSNNQSGMGFNNQNRTTRFPPPLMRPLDPALSLVAKYERRIAELEQQDRAFKAGLTMGLQALGSRAGTGPIGSGDFGNYSSSSSNNSTFRNLGDFASNDNFSAFNRGFKDSLNQFDRDRNAWQRSSVGRSTFGNTSTLGNGFGGISGGSSFGGSFGGSTFSNFGSGPGFGNFGIGSSGFNSSFGGIGSSGMSGIGGIGGVGGIGSGNFRNLKGNKSRWSC